MKKIIEIKAIDIEKLELITENGNKEISKIPKDKINNPIGYIIELGFDLNYEKSLERFFYNNVVDKIGEMETLLILNSLVRNELKYKENPNFIFNYEFMKK